MAKKKEVAKKATKATIEKVVEKVVKPKVVKQDVYYEGVLVTSSEVKDGAVYISLANGSTTIATEDEFKARTQG